MQSSAFPSGPLARPWLVTAEGAADCLDVRAVLDRDRENDRAVARVRIRRRVGLVVVQEDFPDPTIGESTDCRGVAQASDLDLESLAEASVGKPLSP
jgi:hypothetical protein